MVPVFLPDGRHFVYLRASRIDPAESGLYLGDLETPADRQSTDRLVATPFGGSYVPSAVGDGQLLFLRDGVLMAMPFDINRRVMAGEPRPVVNAVGSFRDTASFSASTGTLVYRGAAPAYQLTWLDRRGVPKGVVGEPAELGGSVLSPDGNRVAMWRQSRLSRSSRELWLLDITRNTTTPFATEPEADMPAWSTDGMDLYFALGTRGASINRKRADGSRPAETLLQAGGRDVAMYAGGTVMNPTPDGRFLVVAVEEKEMAIDLWLVPLSGGTKPVPLLQQDFDQIDGRVSPDGRWLAYVSNESGTNEVFVRPLKKDSTTGVPVAGSPLPVSSGGGTAPRWRKDARELFYLSRGGAVMAVVVDAASVGKPSELFRAAGMQTDWSVTADGQRFLVAVPAREGASAFRVVVNWQSPLRR